MPQCSAQFPIATVSSVRQSTANDGAREGMTVEARIREGNVMRTLDATVPFFRLLAASALIMVVGIVNLFGIETIAASAAATLVP